MEVNDEFRLRIKELDDKISNLKDVENRSSPILDGIVDIKEYVAQDFKIMWILKEVNSEDDNDEWDLRDLIAKLKQDYGILNGWAGTFNPIVYSTYGLVNNKFWSEIPNTDANPEVIDVLKQIAYVNIKKIPGGALANHTNLLNSYNIQKDILISQIDLFEPNIIICGGTFSYIKNDLILDEFEQIGHLPRNIYYSPEKVIIDTFHPNNRTISQEKYCDSIINAVLEWKKKYHKF